MGHFYFFKNDHLDLVRIFSPTLQSLPPHSRLCSQVSGMSLSGAVFYFLFSLLVFYFIFSGKLSPLPEVPDAPKDAAEAPAASRPDGQLKRELADAHESSKFEIPH
jgi:hypothetical protein